MRRFTDKQIKVLKALAHYKFLTYDQMLRLGIASYKSNLSKLINELISERKSYIEKIPHNPGIPAKFYLTKYGKEILLEYSDLSEQFILFPLGKIRKDTQDQKHRSAIIDLQISLDLCAPKENAQVLFCDRYFDKVGDNRTNKNLKSKTGIPYSEGSVKADMIFKLQTNYQEELYILELENGKDTQKSFIKCKEHAQVLFEGSVHEKYDHRKGYRTLWIFEHSSTMNSTIVRLQEDPYFENAHEFFLFNTLESVSENFFIKWKNVKKLNRKLFYS